MKILIFLALFTSACTVFESHQEKKDLLTEIIFNTSESLPISAENISTLVIIPRRGCSGCISVADYFFKTEGAGNERVQFVFTKLSSMKEMHAKIDKDLLSSSNVYLDKEGEFSRGGLDTIYPTVVFIKGGEIDRIELLTPDKKDLFKEVRKNTNHSVN